MSYTIEYARQFIRSEAGITPCWLAGDNNVTEGRGRYERRVRNWSCFNNFIGVTEKEIMNTVQSWLGGYQEHWKRNGKWVDDKGLINWVKSGIRSAATVEDILRRNPECCGSIRCCVHMWQGFKHTIEERSYVRTTTEFDDWIQRYRILKAKLEKNQIKVYPHVDFGTEKIRAPLAASGSDKFYFQKKWRYLTRLSEYETCWGKDTDSALTFSYDEALDILRTRSHFVAGASLVKVPKTQSPKVIIQITQGAGTGNYIYQITPKRLFTSGMTSAYRYSSPKAAQLALERIFKRYPSITDAVVITL